MVSGVRFTTLQSFAAAFKEHYKYLSYFTDYFPSGCISRNTHASKLQCIILFQRSEHQSHPSSCISFPPKKTWLSIESIHNLAVGTLVSSLGFLVAKKPRADNFEQLLTIWHPLVI